MTIRHLAHLTAARRIMLVVGGAAGLTFGTAGTSSIAAVAAGPPPPEYPAITDFCTAYLVVEQAAASEDWETVGTAVEALAEHAPASLADAIGVIAGTMITLQFETAEFAAAYEELVDTAVTECNFNTVDVTLMEYGFGGIPPELPAGVTAFRAANVGAEVHELIVFGFNEGVTTTLDEWFALPDEEADQMITFSGVTIVYPGTSGNLVADLTPGRYVAICFLPAGAAPELVSQLPPGPPDPTASYPAHLAALLEAPPHFVHGMVQEFVVTEV